MQGKVSVLSVVDWHTLKSMQEIMANLEVIMTHVYMIGMRQSHESIDQII